MTLLRSGRRSRSARLKASPKLSQHSYESSPTCERLRITWSNGTGSVHSLCWVRVLTRFLAREKEREELYFLRWCVLDAPAALVQNPS